MSKSLADLVGEALSEIDEMAPEEAHRILAAPERQG